MTDIHFLSASEVEDLTDGYLVTVNMQHLYTAFEEPDLADTFFGSPFARHCIDGRGARSVISRHVRRALPIVAGNAALERALRNAEGRRVLVIGSSEAAIAGTADRFCRTTFVHVGGRYAIGDRESAKTVAAAIVADIAKDNDFAFLAIALGVGKQELLAEALAPLIKAPIFCIGGSFEMLSGELRRAPAIVQRLGLEAIWRLLLQPNPTRLERLAKSYGYFFLFRSRVLKVERALGC